MKIGFSSGKSKINIDTDQIKAVANVLNGNDTNSETAKAVDGTLDILVKIFAYIKLAFSKVWSVIKTACQWCWVKFLKYIYDEVAALVIAIVGGFAFIFGGIFAWPFKGIKYVINAIKKYEADAAAAKAAKKAAAANTQSGWQTFVKNLKTKYNSISFVKEQNAQKAANLVPYVLNPDTDSIKYPDKQTFRYLVKNSEGEIVTGYFPAFSKMDVYSYLMDQNMIVYEIETSKMINFVHAQGGNKTKMALKDLVFWLAQLSTYIKAGIPLAEGVKVLAQQDNRSKYKGIYQSIIYELTMGQTFSEALEKQGSAFPALLVNMIKSSEMVGNIEDTLDEMSDYYQEIVDTKRAVVSALAYPAVVMVFAIGIVIFMLTYIVPKFVEVYESMDAELNPITIITLKISDFLQNDWLWVVLGITIIVVTYSYCFKNVKSFRKTMQGLFLRLPVVGPLLVAKEINMFSRTFATLQKNNVLIADSIDVLSKITSNELYKELMDKTINNLIKGNKMSESFKNNWIIPDIAYFMIVTGESTGELAEMLDKVADFYAKQEKNSVAMIKTFIEPVMIVFLAIMVGFILIAILVPMFGIYSTVA